jgi:hypothetical protein
VASNICQALLAGFSCQPACGLAADWELAVRGYRAAAGQGHAAAQCELGTAYVEGHGVQPDASKAMEWFQLAAAQGRVCDRRQRARSCPECTSNKRPLRRAHHHILGPDRRYSPRHKMPALMLKTKVQMRVDDATGNIWQALLCGEPTAQLNIGLLHARGSRAAHSFHFHLVRHGGQGESLMPTYTRATDFL